jgi:hypothetical protein
MRWVLVAVLMLGPAASHAQGLGDAARKEKNRQKANAAAGVKARSVDDDALKSGSEGTGQGTCSSTGTATPDQDGAKPVPEADAAQQSPRGEAGAAPSGTEDLQRRIDTWRSRYRPAKARVESLEREIAELEAKESNIAGIATDKSRYRDPTFAPTPSAQWSDSRGPEESWTRQGSSFATSKTVHAATASAQVSSTKVPTALTPRCGAAAELAAPR